MEGKMATTRKLGLNYSTLEELCSMANLARRMLANAFALTLLLSAGAVRPVQAQTYTVLHSFTGTDGTYPYSRLVRDDAGNLYGTTSQGGAHSLGTVFQVEPSGTVHVLHDFTYLGGDGVYPYAGLVRDKDGNLYGTTYQGGVNGLGAVFKLDASNGYDEAWVYSFKGKTYGDGAYPWADLIIDESGNLYGTTTEGGSASDLGYGYGTVFKVDPSGIENVLFGFPSYYDGANPAGGLVMDPSGNLYGTTAGGGPVDANGYGHGVAFKLDASNSYAESVLHSFKPSLGDGGGPQGDLVMDGSGNLYGTTVAGGCLPLCYGTVFELNTSSLTETLVYSFAGTSGDGIYPNFSGVVRDASGNLYGTTDQGGDYGYGTVFKIDTSGNETVLHSFAGHPDDGAHPRAGLTIDAAGNLYGTTYIGGSLDQGTVFELVVSPQGATQAIIDQVNAFYSQGVLNKGQDNSLVKELKQAIKLMNAGKTGGAISSLEDFISEVVDLQNSGVLSADQASILINAAKGVIAQLI